mgnify:FL=1
MPPEAVEAQKAAFSKAQTDLAALTKTVEMQQTTIATFEKERRVAKYTKLAGGWQAIPGKPDEIGAQLAETEEKAGVKVAEMVVAQFTAANKAAEDAGVLIPLGRAKKGDGTSPADAKLKEFQATGLNHAKAVVKLSKENPGLFREYQVANLGNGGNSDGE